MRYEKIPKELQKMPRWVSADRGSKIPKQTGGDYPASCSDPSTWATFASAATAVEVGVHDDIGFVFANDGFVGIDIDAGYGEDGFLSDLAIDIIGKCKSYTEKSRSGRGFHILLRGNIPFKGKNNRNGVEIYKTGRYFIMTGNVLIYDKIIENQNAINYIVDKYFPDMRETSSNKCRTWRAYSPIWEQPLEDKIKLRPKYPTIPDGCRNISLASLAGAMHNQGYCSSQIYNELLYCNKVACEPPLPAREVENIVNSISRYRRTQHD